MYFGRVVTKTIDPVFSTDPGTQSFAHKTPGPRLFHRPQDPVAPAPLHPALSTKPGREVTSGA